MTVVRCHGSAAIGVRPTAVPHPARQVRADTANSDCTKVTGKDGHEIRWHNLAFAVGAALAAIAALGGLFAAKAAPTVIRSGEPLKYMG